MRLLVFGGSGFVGTRVLRSALNSGLRVASVSRGGAPSALEPDLASVEWLKADAEKPAELGKVLEGADAVVSCVGAFGSNEFMRRINGDANAAIAEAAAAAGVKRFVYVSAETFRPVKLLLPGYFEGKGIAEAAVTQHFGENGCVLRPPAVYGTRAVGKYVKLPIGLIGAPLAAILSTTPMRTVSAALGPVGDLLMPWVSADAVAEAAIAHVVGGGDGGDGGGGGGDEAASASKPQGEAVVLGWEEINRAALTAVAMRPSQVTLFWDGGCPLCKREIAYYKTLDPSGRVDWVDIHAEPQRLAPHRISLDAAMSRIHALDSRGQLHVGVPAFLLVWEQLPFWNGLPPLLRAVPFAMPLASAAYSVFARVRLQITGRARALGAATACDPKESP